MGASSLSLQQISPIQSRNQVSIKSQPSAIQIKRNCTTSKLRNNRLLIKSNVQQKKNSSIQCKIQQNNYFNEQSKPQYSQSQKLHSKQFETFSQIKSNQVSNESPFCQSQLDLDGQNLNDKQRFQTQNISKFLENDRTAYSKQAFQRQMNPSLIPQIYQQGKAHFQVNDSQIAEDIQIKFVQSDDKKQGLDTTTSDFSSQQNKIFDENYFDKILSDSNEQIEGQMKLPTYKDVLLASQKLKGYTHQTHVMTSSTINNELGALLNGGKGGKLQVFFKCENMQRTGSFKFRGAFNAINNLSQEQKKAGALAYSAGNHGQGVALSGRILGLKTKIIMPKDAPQLKIDAIKGYGADIVFFDRYSENIDEIIKKQTEETKMTFVDPFDNHDVIAGQGTLALELFDEVGQLDHMLMAIGGGGLVSGCCLVSKTVSPGCKVYAVEPGDGGIDAFISLQKNEVISVNNQKTIADGASTPHIGEYTLKIMQQHLDECLAVPDDDLVECMKFFAERCKMIVEPTGCLGLAGLKKIIKEGKVKDGDKIGIVISGGNIDLIKFQKIMTDYEQNQALKVAQQNLLNINNSILKNNNESPISQQSLKEFGAGHQAKV